MLPVHDVDAILLLSLTVAAKRRPADLVEIITAIALANDVIPNQNKLSEAFARMSACSLIVEIDGGYTLSDDAQAMMASQRNRDDTAKKIDRLKSHLADYQPQGKHPGIRIGHEQIIDAIEGFNAARNDNYGKNLLTTKPKPKVAWIPKKELSKHPLPIRTRHKPKST